MVVFEGKAFDEKKVATLEVITSVAEIKLAMNDGLTLYWHCKSNQEAVSKVNEIACLINKREEELLKLKAN